MHRLRYFGWDLIGSDERVIKLGWFGSAPIRGSADGELNRRFRAGDTTAVCLSNCTWIDWAEFANAVRGFIASDPGWIWTE